MPHVTLTDPDSGATIRVVSQFGFNCYEFVAVAGGRRFDVLSAQPDFISDNIQPSRSGIPILFPFPNRIRAGRFTWDGREYELPANLVHHNAGNAIHGFCYDRPWRIIEQTANTIIGEFHFSQDDPGRRQLWPADFQIQVRYEVLGPALRCDITITNPDTLPLPFGLGTHPYFKLPLDPRSSYDDCLIEVPAAAKYELDGGLPTGRIVPVDPAIDLRDGATLGGVKFDDVYTQLRPESHGVVCRVVDPAGWQVVQTCDAKFREIVVCTPHWAGAVCLEPYTCVTDAINLQQSSHAACDAGLRVLEPGGIYRTWFELRVEPVVA